MRYHEKLALFKSLVEAKASLRVATNPLSAGPLRVDETKRAERFLSWPLEKLEAELAKPRGRRGK